MFFGLNVVNPWSDPLARIQTGVDGVKWTTPENLHLTLLFLGKITPEIFETFVQSKKLYQLPSPTLEVHGVGVFPTLDKPHVMWAAIKQDDTLTALYQTLRHAALELGIPVEDRPYTPHITLGRVSRRVQQVQAWCVEHERFQLPKTSFPQLNLMERENTDNGHLYATRHSFKLTKEATCQ